LPFAERRQKIIAMKVLVTAAVLLLAGAAQAQTPPGQAPVSNTPPPASTLTRDLNSGPPAPAVYLAPAPAPMIAPVVTPPAPTAAPAPRPASTVAPAAALPAAAPPARVAPAAVPTSVPPRPVAVAPAPVVPAPQPRAAPVTPPPAAVAPRIEPAPAVAPAVAPVAVPPPPAPPSVTVLDSAARAALPFTADLPPGFEIVTGRPGPDFRVYTIRRGDQSFVMVYAGPASQFPIYSGQMVEAGGRASIVSTEDGERHAVEHLFQRPTAPTEVHVWTMSLDGADRAMAEEIAQSVDVR
jgi:hypothetical protein